jgi:sulfate permease, SulP family
METAGPARAALRSLGPIAAGMMVCLLSVAMTVSFAAIIFVGPLAGAVSQGIGLGLFGGLALAGVSALTASYRGTICFPQDVTAILLSLSAAGIAARLGPVEPEALLATVALLIVTASLATGVAFVAAGVFRLGFLARFIPYPVLGGFLAATGYLLTMGAIGMTTGLGPSAALLQPGAVERWLPVVVLGVLILWTTRRTGNALVVPALLVAAFVAFYALIALLGIDLDEAGRRGLLLGPFAERGGFFVALHPDVLARADAGAVLAEAPALLTLVGLALVGAILNASGLELATGKPVDLNRDLRGIGLANAAAGLGGGPPGYHILSVSLLAQRITGADSRWIGLAVALAFAVTLVAGADLLAVLPIGVFAALLVFLGLDLLYEWLWVERRRLPLPDFAIILVILGTAATFGFLEAVALGVLVASILFLVAYSRLDVVRARLTARLRSSTTERSEAATARLQARGDETLIVELQGYVFFGTAHALYASLAGAIGDGASPVRRVVLDFRRVQGLDVSAVFNLGKLELLCRQRGIVLALSDMSPRLRRPADLAGLTARALVFPTLDAALAWAEEAVLAEEPEPDPRTASGIATVLARIEAAGHSIFAAETVPAGTGLFAQGDPSDCLVLIESGQLSARVGGRDGGAAITVARFLPGAVVGEIGLCTRSPRTATVTADVDSRIRRATTAELDRLAADDPALARDLHAALARQLAHRLARTTALLREVSR